MKLNNLKLNFFKIYFFPESLEEAKNVYYYCSVRINNSILIIIYLFLLLLGNYGPQTSPIQISVNHPFLFFVIDRDLDVAVMAGRIVNPLNVRIQ